MSTVHPDTNPTVFTDLVSSGPVRVGVDTSLNIVIWFPRPFDEFTVTNVDALIDALNIARDRRHILEQGDGQ